MEFKLYMKLRPQNWIQSMIWNTRLTWTFNPDFPAVGRESPTCYLEKNEDSNVENEDIVVIGGKM